MLNFERQITKIFQTLAEKNNWQLQTYSEGFVLEMKSEKSKTRVFGYQFENSTASSSVATDKCACSEILQGAGIQALEHFLFLPEEKLKFVKTQPDVSALLQKHGKLVAKPNAGTSGQHIYAFETMAEFEKIKDKISPFSRDIAISPYIPLAREFRCIILAGKPVLVYEKIKGEDWKFNLAHGAIPIVHPLGNHQSTEGISKRVASELGLEFCAVDVAKTEDGNFVCVEANSGIMMERFSAVSEENYKIASEIYQRGLEYFLAKNEVKNG